MAPYSAMFGRGWKDLVKVVLAVRRDWMAGGRVDIVKGTWRWWFACKCCIEMTVGME